MKFQRNVIPQNIYLLFFCLPVISLSMRRVNPGENVTIQCDLTDPRIHWYRQSPGQLPLAILHSLSSTYTDAWYFNGFGHHYSLAAHNRLFIHNVTAEDSGIYYCARKEDDTLTFHNGTELNVAGAANNNSDTSINCTNGTSIQPDNEPETWKTGVMTVSLILNFILLIINIVLLRDHFCAKKPEQVQERSQPQELEYALVQPIMTHKRINTKEIHTTYAEVQFT